MKRDSASFNHSIDTVDKEFCAYGNKDGGNNKPEMVKQVD